MPDSPDPDWEAIANAQPLTGEELETAVTDRLVDILTPNSGTATPVPTANAQLTFAGTAHRLEAEPKNEPVPVDMKKEKEEPIAHEPETVPETPSTADQIKQPSVPTESPAPTSEVQAPLEWDNWQIRILRPAPKPIVPDTDPPTTMPASKPYMPEMPIIPPDALAETVDLTDPEFP
eukprot:5266028-Amphidinium_carterae.1